MWEHISTFQHCLHFHLRSVPLSCFQTLPSITCNYLHTAFSFASSKLSQPIPKLLAQSGTFLKLATVSLLVPIFYLCSLLLWNTWDWVCYMEKGFGGACGCGGSRLVVQICGCTSPRVLKWCRARSFLVLLPCPTETRIQSWKLHPDDFTKS